MVVVTAAAWQALVLGVCYAAVEGPGAWRAPPRLLWWTQSLMAQLHARP
jgi:hypothetical protein